MTQKEKQRKDGEIKKGKRQTRTEKAPIAANRDAFEEDASNRASCCVIVSEGLKAELDQT